MERYGRLIELVHKHKPMTIVEVGTFDGTRALQMVEAALQHNPYVHYTRYDLFNTTDIDTHRREFNVADGTNELIKKPLTMHDIAAKFDQSPLDFTYQLVMGDTRSTLRVHTDDFAFIDGGHSVETIRLDYEKLRRCSVVVFDDYYKDYPHTEQFGANKIVDEIPGAIVHEFDDWMQHGGRICIAEVVN